MPDEKKISKQIGWLNYNTGLKQRISCSDVLPALVELGVTQAMQILKDVEQVAPSLDDPTNYILASVGQAVVDGPPVTNLGVSVPPPRLTPVAPRSVPPAPLNRPLFKPELERSPASMHINATLDPTGKIARQVGWLNAHVPLKEKLSFADLVHPLSQLDISSAMKIFKEVEDNADNVEKPTSYVVAAASRLLPTFTPGTARANNKRPATWSPALPAPHQAPAPRAAPPTMVANPTAPNASPTDEDGRKISRQVAWLNQHAGLPERISYSDVKDALEACDLRTAMRILKDCENMRTTVRNPTSYVVASAEKALARGAVKGGAGDNARALTECWDFQQGRCPRGDKCRYVHDTVPLQLAVTDIASVVGSLGLGLGEEALLDLASIPFAEAEAIVYDMAEGTKAKANPDAHVARICSRVRAEAYAPSVLHGDPALDGSDELVVKRLRLTST